MDSLIAQCKESRDVDISEILVDTDLRRLPSLVTTAVKMGYTLVVELLLHTAKHLHPDNSKIIDYDAAGSYLRSAAEHGHLRIVRLLLKRGADANATRDRGETALHKAANAGHLEVVRLLLENGVDANFTGGCGWTALGKAAKNGHLGVVRLLWENGADANIKGDSALNRGSAYARDVSHCTGETLHRHSSHREHSRGYSRLGIPPFLSSRPIEYTRWSPPSTYSRSSSGTHPRCIEEAPNQQLSSSPRAVGPRVAFNPEVETRYFGEAPNQQLSSSSRAGGPRVAFNPEVETLYFEEAPNQQLSSSPRAEGPRVAFNPEAKTRYFEEAPNQQLSSSPRARSLRVAYDPEVETHYF